MRKINFGNISKLICFRCLFLDFKNRHLYLMSLYCTLSFFFIQWLNITQMLNIAGSRRFNVDLNWGVLLFSGGGTGLVLLSLYSFKYFLVWSEYCAILAILL